MSQADELLDSLTEEQMAMYGVNPIEEPHITIGSDRTITVPDELKHIAVQGEHNIETVTFDCPRYWDGHDLSAMSMRIVYQRPDGHREPHTAESLRVDDTDTSLIHFDWTISGNVTAVKGNISFMVCAKIADAEGVTEREWHSRLNQDLIVDEGLECSGDEIVEQNPDILESILSRLDTLESTDGVSDEQVANAVEAYLTENPLSSDPESGGNANIDRGKRPMRRIVSFIDDDCQAAVVELLEPVIDAKGVPYTLACPPGNIGGEGYMTLEDLHRMVGKGVSITNHARTQTSMEQFDTAEAFRADVEAAHALFEEWGINVETMAYPQGVYVDEYMPVVREFYRMGFTVNPGINQIPYASCYMDRVNLFVNDAEDDGTASLAAAKGWVDQLADMESGWLVFMTHAWYGGFNPQLLGELIDYIRGQGIEIVDVHEAIDTTGNIAEVGVVKKPLDRMSTPFLVMDAAGQVHTNSLTEYERSIVKYTEVYANYNTNVFLKPAGSLSDSSNDKLIVSLVIPVQPGEEYLLSCSANWGNLAYCIYNSEQGAETFSVAEKYVVPNTADGEILTDHKVTIPEGATYMRVASNKEVQPEGFKIYRVEYTGTEDEEDSGENAEQPWHYLALSENEADAQANSDAITAAVAEHKNVMLKFGNYPVMPGIVVESGTLDLNGATLYSVAYKHSGALVILSGDNPVICGGELEGTYDLADNEDGYAFFEGESLIVPSGVSNAVIRNMDLHNCWGYAITGKDGVVERAYVETATSSVSTNFSCATDKLAIPEGCRYVTAAGSVGYNYIISERPVEYRFLDADGVSVGIKRGVPRERVAIPENAVSVVIWTFTFEHKVSPYYVYFTNYTESLTVEDCTIHHCHSLAMANMCGPTTVSRCRFIGMGKPRPDAAGTSRGTTGGIDIEDIQTPYLIMSDCESEDCVNLLLFGGYNGIVTNCRGAVIRSYRGWRLQLNNCNTSYLDIAGNCPVQTSSTYAETLVVPEESYKYVSGDIATSRFYKALCAFDSFYVDIKTPVGKQAEDFTPAVYNGTVHNRTYQAAPFGGFAPGSKVLFIANPHDGQKPYYGAGAVGEDTYGVTANAPLYTNGHLIADSTFNIADNRSIYYETTDATSGRFSNCTFNLTGGSYFNKFGDKQGAPSHLVFDGCIINNSDYHLFTFPLYAGSVLEFRGCTIADPSKLVKSGADKITIKITDGKAEDYTMLSDSGNGHEYVVTMRNGALTPICRASSIEITTLPTKTEYVAGEVLDLSGMAVSVVRQDGSKAEVSGYTAPTALPSDGVINISYSEFGDTFTASFNVTITEAETAE